MPPALRRIATLLTDPRVALPLMAVWVIAWTAPAVLGHALWGDELRTWRDGIEKPLTLVLSWQHNPDHAPLGHLLARTGAALFGVENAWALRLGNYASGLLCIPALWWMGRTLVSGGVGLLAAAMLCVDPNVLFQITQARMYGVLLLAGVCGFTLAGSILNDPEKPWRRAALLGVALGAGLWAHSQIYALAFAVLGVALAALFRHRRAGLALLAGVVLAGLIGAQGVAKIASRHDAERIESTELGDSGEQLSDAIRRLGGHDAMTAILAASTAGGMIAVVTQRRGWVATLALLVVFFAILNLGIASRYRPIAHVRYLTIMQPPMWIAMAALLVALCTSRFRFTLGIAATGLFVGTSIFEMTRAAEALQPHPLAMPFANEAREIRAELKPGDRFVIVPRSPYGLYARYYGLRTDDAIDNALAERKSARRSREGFRAANLDEGTLWILGVVTPSFDVPHTNDDVIAFTNRVAEARGMETRLPALDLVHETKRVMVIRVDAVKVEVR